MTTPQPATTFDARPLTDPVDPQAVRAFAAELRARGTAGTSVSTIIGFVVVGIVVLVSVPIALSVVIGLLTRPESFGFAGIGLLIFGLIGAGIGVAAVMGWRRARETRYRLDRFARANGMTYEGRIADPPLPGMIFSLGRSRLSTDLVRGTRPRSDRLFDRRPARAVSVLGATVAAWRSRYGSGGRGDSSPVASTCPTRWGRSVPRGPRTPS